MRVTDHSICLALFAKKIDNVYILPANDLGHSHKTLRGTLVLELQLDFSALFATVYENFYSDPAIAKEIL
jgi:hypothetical protein